MRFRAQHYDALFAFGPAQKAAAVGVLASWRHNNEGAAQVQAPVAVVEALLRAHPEGAKAKWVA